MEPHTSRHAKTANIAGILWDLWLDQDNMQHGCFRIESGNQELMKLNSMDP
jgi:hypothetical protein